MLTKEDLELILKYGTFDMQTVGRGGPSEASYMCPCYGTGFSENDLLKDLVDDATYAEIASGMHMVAGAHIYASRLSMEDKAKIPIYHTESCDLHKLQVIWRKDPVCDR